MKLEDQVCTPEQAKRLEQLGVKAMSHLVWVPPFPVFNDELRLCTMTEFDQRLSNSILSQDARNLVSFHFAYTVAELGVMLGKFWEIEIRAAYEFEAKTEAEERAHYLIGALESKLISPSEVNERLKD